MKKLLLLTTLFLAFACSKDDDNGNDLTDPLIGAWSGSTTVTEEEDDGETFTADVEVTFTFNADGSVTEVYAYTLDGQTETETEQSTWSNLSSNPDFSSTNQSYRVGEITATIVFSSNFKTANTTFLDEDEENYIVLTKN